MCSIFSLSNAVLVNVEIFNQFLNSIFPIFRAAFAGVVTIDKLKKEYKKTVPGGQQLQELWDLLSSHLQNLVEANTANLDYISKFAISINFVGSEYFNKLSYLCFFFSTFTEMYIHHVPNDDKDRLRRKVRWKVFRFCFSFKYICCFIRFQSYYS